MKKALENKMNKLAKQFPMAWFKDGGDFCESKSNTIWTGEGSCVGDDYMFCHYGYRDTMGVHPKFEAALKKLGLWAEFYDGGTVFIYES